jgi:7-cyano-7-deazaguanine reductase
VVQAEGRTFGFDGEEAIQPQLLECFPYMYAGKDAVVELRCDEWSCVCPFSGLPDFGTIAIRYCPGEVCIELKSLKYYLTTFRNVGIYQEHAAQRVIEDLVRAAVPKWMQVVLDYRVRGGIHTVVTVDRGQR